MPTSWPMTLHKKSKVWTSLTRSCLLPDKLTDFVALREEKGTVLKGLTG